MKTQRIKIPIIPTHQHFVKIDAPHELDLKAICIFAATGFFLGTDTYWKNLKVLPPGTENMVDENSFWLDSKPWFRWYYEPRNINFDQALDEFTALFEQICKEQAGDKPVLLPLSGGLDSRTQAVAFSKVDNPVTAYSYSFANGYPETKIARKMAAVYGYDFKELTIPHGYLWNTIDDLAELNGCYSDFTHPRQMAVLDDFKAMNGVFSLGHWGDVFFDRGAAKGTTKADIKPTLYSLMVKKGGRELATALWEYWQLEGDFDDYLMMRIDDILKDIAITDVSAKVRAFKTSTWAARWTTVNHCVFEAAHPFQLPYYDERMCEFVCQTPEAFLADRLLQIEYIKKQSPQMAKITWQAQKPYNLYTYQKNKSPHNLPFRVADKVRRTVNQKRGKPLVQRNWELQFLGSENDAQLQHRIFDANLHPFLSKELITRFYNAFRNVDAVRYAHPLSMLLTLSVWYNKNTSL